MITSFLNTIKDLFVKYFPFVVVFTYALFVPSDSDMGWHIKYGEYFFQNHQILRENIFSTEMAGYQWVNSSWATDLITYLTFSKFGFIGLSVLSAAIVTLIFGLFSKVAKLSFWEKALMFPVILYLETPFINVSFRGQLLTLLGVSILYFLFDLYSRGKKKALFLLIPLFALWSNLHGQFILGLGIFLLFIVFFLLQKYSGAKSREEKQEVFRSGRFLFFIFLLSAFATLINPFGANVYTETLKHFANPLQKFIIEWLPFERFSLLWWDLMFWEAVVLISLALTIYKKKFFQNSYFIIPTIILLILSVQVRRYMWVLLLSSIPVAKVLFSTIKPKYEEIAGTIAAFVLLAFYGYIALVKAPYEKVFSMNWDRYCSFVLCSNKAGEYLLNNKPAGKMMTFYNWGGWIIANYYPAIKPSIDGRMHLWRDENGYSAFADYYPYEQNKKDIDQSDYDIVFMSPIKPVHRRLVELVKLGKWKIVYSDAKATVFVREKPQS